MPGSGKKQSEGFRNIQISSAAKPTPNHFWEATGIHCFGELWMLVMPNALKSREQCWGRREDLGRIRTLLSPRVPDPQPPGCEAEAKGANPAEPACTDPAPRFKRGASGPGQRGSRSPKAPRAATAGPGADERRKRVKEDYFPPHLDHPPVFAAKNGLRRLSSARYQLLDPREFRNPNGPLPRLWGPRARSIGRSDGGPRACAPRLLSNSRGRTICEDAGADLGDTSTFYEPRNVRLSAHRQKLRERHVRDHCSQHLGGTNPPTP
ncbi:uncharacterized protein LOC100938712 isoform X2 [Pongo abelii]|uniref:uncharacterized protein LOC100938712 isoform X2 n=1 Tax=Pongo abelii TaxID=9601 RepID=UPI0023E828C7|nr:uncharacterized protein LOC100938712 isoform X2 [Pongo abelii]